MKKYLSILMALILSLTMFTGIAVAEEEPAPMAVLVPCSIGDPFVAMCLDGLYQLSE